ncbi:hypothetical protein CR513_19004, partial [Mucuna pruriens]
MKGLTMSPKESLGFHYRGIRRTSIESWKELKREIRERFVPLYYKRDLFVKLQKMYQCSRSFEE